MRRLLLALALLCIGGPAYATVPCAPLPFVFVNGTIANATQVNANFNAVMQCVTSLATQVPTNAQLILQPTASYPQGVWRFGVNTLGDAPPLLFIGETGTCASHGLVSDVGGCNDTTAGDGNSWRAIHAIPTEPLVTQWGVWADNNANDYTTPFQNAINYVQTIVSIAAGGAQGFSGKVIIPGGGGAMIALRSGVTVSQGVVLSGASRFISALCACTGDTTVVTLEGHIAGFTGLEHLAVFGSNALGLTTAPLGPAVTGIPSAGGTFGAHNPAVLVDTSAVGYYLNDIDVYGGFTAITVYAGDGTMQWVGAHGSYGNAVIRVGGVAKGGGGFWNRLSMDSGIPTGAFPSNGTINAWASGTPYTTNTIVSVSFAASTYWLQATNNGTSGGGSAPVPPNFGGTTNDNGILWGLVGRADNGGLRVDGIPGEVYITNSDLSGPYENAISLTNSQSGSGGAGAFKCVLCLPSGALDTQVLIDVATGPVIINSTHTGAPLEPGFYGVQISSNFTGRAVIEGNEIQGYDGAVDAVGGSASTVILSNNKILQNAAGTAVFISQNAAAYSLFEGNIIAGSATTGFSLQGSSANVQIKNNVCATGITCTANSASSTAGNLVSGNTGDGPDPQIGVVRSCVAAINANVANTDHQIPIPMPRGKTLYRVSEVDLSNASISLTTATFGLFTQSGGGGTAIVAGATALSPLTATGANASGSLFLPTVVNQASAVYTPFSLTTPVVYLRVQVAQGAAATFDACFSYAPQAS